MGQFLSQPVTEKGSESGGDEFIKYGLSIMQGWRVSMEDSHSTVLDLNNIKTYKETLAEEGNATEVDKEPTDNTKADVIKPFDEQIAFFGVFDGHGGAKVAAFTGDHLPGIVKEQHELLREKKYAQALQNSFLACDRAILQDPWFKNDSSGCAATTIMMTKEKLICANSGDSRIVLSIDGYAKAMSYDHKPSNEGEKARIVAAGGFVDMGRVNGNLALSRCIGDFDFKKSPNLPAEEQIVTAFPDIIEHDLNYAHDEFLILACDGIWDCLTSQQAVELVRKGIHERLSLSDICEKIIDVCVAPNSMGTGIGCDNMSICVAALLNGKNLDDWYEEIIAKGGPVSTEFKDVRREIYNTDLGPNESSEGQFPEPGADAEEGKEGDAENFSTIGKSLSQLINKSSATFQDGTYYIDASNSSSLLATLGMLGNGAEADSSEEATVEEVSEEGETKQSIEDVNQKGEAKETTKN